MTSQYRKSPTVYAPPTLYARLFRHVGHAHASSARERVTPSHGLWFRKTRSRRRTPELFDRQQ